MGKKEPVIELELYLVRHGESTGNVPDDGTEKSYEYRNDFRLTERGKLQAEYLGERFEDMKLDCILASGYSRAIATASAVASHQPDGGYKDVEVHPIFCECGVTDYKGRTVEEIKEEFPLAKKAVGAEHFERMLVSDKTTGDDERIERAKKAISYLRERFHNGEKVLVAAHACFNTFLYFAAIGLSPDQKFDVNFCNTGVTKIVFWKEGTGPYVDIGVVYQNDSSHLYKKFPGFIQPET